MVAAAIPARTGWTASPLRWMRLKYTSYYKSDRASCEREVRVSLDELVPSLVRAPLAPHFLASAGRFELDLDELDSSQDMDCYTPLA